MSPLRKAGGATASADGVPMAISPALAPADPRSAQPAKNSQYPIVGSSAWRYRMGRSFRARAIAARTPFFARSARTCPRALGFSWHR